MSEESSDTKDATPSKGPSRRRLVLLYVQMTVVTGLILGLIGVVYVAFARALPHYNSVTQAVGGWEGRIHRSDPVLGYAPIPGTQGAELVALRPPLPMRYDQNGFRIPVSGEPDRPMGTAPRPVILSFGGSFTYGAKTDAEGTFPFLVGAALGGTTRNAGLSSYGLSQMLILARRLISEIKPDIVLVQYSPWLAERARTPFMPSAFGLVPQPYVHGESVELRGPPFRGIISDLPVHDYVRVERSALGFVSFLVRVALPLAVSDTFNLIGYHVRLRLGLLPEPTADSVTVERAIYTEIASLANEHGATAVLVTLGIGPEPASVPQDVVDQYLFVDAQKTLIDQLPTPDTDSWIERYAHWAGDPPRPVDTHPNPLAHEIIAREIITAVNNAGEGTSPGESR